MTPRYDTISFLSDYGHDDEFVGVVKSVIRTLAPHVAVIDVTHNIAAHDVRAGALALARSVQYLASGVVLAVVDPGVATARRAIAVEVGDGQAVLVGPDNGLLAPAVAMCGGATRAVELTNDEFHLPSPGPTFAGRDVFAPAAAQLCMGVPLEQLGAPLDVHLLTPGMMPVSREEGEVLVAEVLWIDRYGNAQLNIDPDDLARFGARLRIKVRDSERIGARVDAYAQIPPGVIGLVTDSYGLVALSSDRTSAAAELGVSEGDEVRIEPLDDDRTTAVPIRLAPKGNRS